MTRALPLVWLIIVISAGFHLAWRIAEGLTFQTDLMALLPREDQNIELGRATESVTKAISQRLIILVGHPRRDEARSVAAEIIRRLKSSSLTEINGVYNEDRLRQLGSLYFPYRRGLLADDDRQRLLEGRAEEISIRALSQVYGFAGAIDARLLRQDPFLLSPAFFAGLPLPNSKLALDEGMLTLNEDGMVWVLLAARLTDEPYSLDVQERLIGHLALDGLISERAGTQILKLGAVFFAQAGAKAAMDESSSLGVASTIGAILLILIVFRAASPLVLCLLVICVGVLCALSACLWIFGDLHVGALLFGVSLIGVAVDYGIQYCAETFGPAASASERLRRVFIAITIGASTTVVGYLTLFLAPFPGLHQIAAFSATGLVAAWLTVVLWLPLLDRSSTPSHARRVQVLAGGVTSFWEHSRFGLARLLLLTAAIMVGGAGLMTLRTDDNVRRMQSLSPRLVAEQEKLQSLIGSSGGSQLFLVEAPNVEEALQREEALIERLKPLLAQKELISFQASAQFVPSAARQRENRALISEQLEKPLMAAHIRQLGLTEPPEGVVDDGPPLTLAEAATPDGPLGFLSFLSPRSLTGGTLQLVALEGVRHPEVVAKATEGLQGVRFIDPAGDFSLLLGKYRWRAVALLVLSTALMFPVLAWRYGLRRSFIIMTPPIMAVILTPGFRALSGGAFSFFDAMALVLVLSIGVDYTVFYAETTPDRKAVTMVAVATAAGTTLMSFGLLSLSSVRAVHTFGATMTVGVLLALIFAPMAGRRGS